MSILKCINYGSSRCLGLEGGSFTSFGYASYASTKKLNAHPSRLVQRENFRKTELPYSPYSTVPAENTFACASGTPAVDEYARVGLCVWSLSLTGETDTVL